jgi:uncharacterized protein
VPERIYFARSTDDGRTYSTRVDVSDAPTGVEHCFPAAELEVTSDTMAISHGIHLPDIPPLLHYAERVEVLIWPLRRIL